MNFLKALFTEKSDVSMMRVMSMISLLVGTYLAIVGKNTSVEIFVYAALGGKAVQKFFETKKKSEDKEEK